MLIRFENSDDVSNVSIDGNIYARPIFPEMIMIGGTGYGLKWNQSYNFCHETIYVLKFKPEQKIKPACFLGI